MTAFSLRDDARGIWQAGVDAVDPFRLVLAILRDPNSSVANQVRVARRIEVIGGGKAGTAMARAVETALPADRVDLGGWVNVPAGMEQSLPRVHLHAARPAGSNHPDKAGVVGVSEMLKRVDSLGPQDLLLCLLSGGGSALLPAPAAGLTLDDKQQTNRLLHACGATINELNCVRKHLSNFKGGRFAQRAAERGCPVVSLILSDVVGDPLDVIASGPTAADPTTFADALGVLNRYGLQEQVPQQVLAYLQRGLTGEISETLKQEPTGTTNIILGSNRVALTAAADEARRRGYHVLDLGAFLEGETGQVARIMASIIRSNLRDGVPLSSPWCLLSGGETTVTLPPNPGRGGRNQEFVLTLLEVLDDSVLENLCALSGGTDGEDGPTDAAGALADSGTRTRASGAGCEVADHLTRHDSYPYFAAAGDLLLTGPTGTNVADIRVIIHRR